MRRALLVLTSTLSFAACPTPVGDDAGGGPIADAGLPVDEDGGGGGDAGGGDAGNLGDAGPPPVGDAGVARPEIDPAPGIDTPGVHDDGTDCPAVTPAVNSVAADSATTHTFTGTATGAVGNGSFYVEGPNAEEIAGDIPVTSGSYTVTLPMFCGTSLTKRVFSNATCTTVVVTEVVTADCVDADIRITLVWDGLGRDFELHLIKPGGTINDNATDCTWTSCVNSSPDWGVTGDATDDPHKDVDDTGDWGPENIWLSSPETGTYTVLVEHWSSSGDPLADGRVIINLFGKLVVVDIVDFAPYEVWTAATIKWPEAEVVTSQDIHDCAANWSAGCRDALP